MLTKQPEKTNIEKNVVGIFALLVVIFIITAIINPKFLNAYNIQNLIKWSSLYAVMSIGVAMVIITGGIDLSLGSVVGLVAVVLAFLLKGSGVGTVDLYRNYSSDVPFYWSDSRTTDHQGKIQPLFVVTLCGLLIYRSLGRWLTDNQSLGPAPLEGDKGYENLDQIKSLDFIFSGKIPIWRIIQPSDPFLFLLIFGSSCRGFSPQNHLGSLPVCIGK